MRDQHLTRAPQYARQLRRPGCAFVLVLGAIVLLGNACGVVWNAPTIRIVVTGDRIDFAGPRDRARTVGGETVIELMNNSDQRRRLVLARVDEVGELPRELREAEFPRDDSRIVDMTNDLRARRASVTQALAYEYDFGRFHIHLRRDQVYVLFDTLGEGDDVDALWFVPGPEGAGG